MSWLQWIQFCLALGPQALALVMAIEAIVGTGNGAQKRGLAVSGLAASAQLAGATDAQIQQVTSIAPALIDSTVAALNAAGTFKTGTPTKS
jgi:hypothetical protein